ncbi:hypothetical protein BJV82DRAFT_717015 [Fennellomyces sp. T-0311]|nr:hypothetical protein BJV82DRAFT_717015 [Fennellomyces sp. T-0311]
MVSFPLERAQSAITKNEWITFIRIYKFLIEQSNLGNFVNNKPWRKLLEEALGIGEPMAKEIIALSKGNKMPKEPKQTMRKFALDRVKVGKPVTAQLLQDHLKDERIRTPCLTVLKEDMKKAGLRDIAKIFCKTATDRELQVTVKQEVAYNQVLNCTEVQLARQLYTHFSDVDRQEALKFLENQLLAKALIESIFDSSDDNSSKSTDSEYGHSGNEADIDKDIGSQKSDSDMDDEDDVIGDITSTHTVYAIIESSRYMIPKCK